jgi:hypothetical protein
MKIGSVCAWKQIFTFEKADRFRDLDKIYSILAIKYQSVLFVYQGASYQSIYINVSISTALSHSITLKTTYDVIIYTMFYFQDGTSYTVPVEMQYQVEPIDEPLEVHIHFSEEKIKSIQEFMYYLSFPGMTLDTKPL